MTSDTMIKLQPFGCTSTTAQSEKYWRKHIAILRKSKMLSLKHIADTIEEGLEIELNKLERNTHNGKEISK